MQLAFRFSLSNENFYSFLIYTKNAKPSNRIFTAVMALLQRLQSETASDGNPDTFRGTQIHSEALRHPQRHSDTLRGTPDAVTF